MGTHVCVFDLKSFADFVPTILGGFFVNNKNFVVTIHWRRTNLFTDNRAIFRNE